MSDKIQEELSTFMQSVKRQTTRIPTKPFEPDLSPTTSDQGEVVSRPSNSRLTDLYGTREFQTEWANEVQFHVARNLLHLRRYRNMTQDELADAANTSQSAIARIESGQENITLETFRKLVTALRGRFYVSVPPEEYPPVLRRPWWEAASSTLGGAGHWQLVGFLSGSTANANHVLLGFERTRSANENTPWFVPSGPVISIDAREHEDENNR
jgi:transcriptional regulator with XRE-family HTH domain